MDELKEKVKSLPEKPGVYQFLDSQGKIIYIGKAKNLRKRVSSYFTKHHDSPKTRLLVKQIADLKYITVDTESEAFLLENVLIKHYQPKYNIQLKDDKSYPWIVIKKEHFPRVMMTRTIENDGSEYYGPYTSVDMAKTLINIFKKVYHIRSCKYNLTPENIAKGKFKVCLDYHIGLCKAPCVGLQSEEDYNKNIDQIRKILKGNISSVIEMLKKEMFRFSEKLEFEQAKLMKTRIELLENYQSRSLVVNPSIKNVDVFTYLEDKNYAYVNFIKVVSGKIIRAYSTEIKKKLDEPKEEILSYAIVQIRKNIQKGVPDANEILVPFNIPLQLKGVKIHIPQRGDKKKLLELSEKNLKFFMLEKQKARLNVDPNKNAIKVLEKMKQELNLKNIPIHIECFDNSNLFGTNPVSACVVFKYGRPAKSEYRKFNVKTVEGIDDFATMREVVYRRYRRLLDEGKDLPDLIIIDGGKGQLSAAYQVLKELNLADKIDLIAIAKRYDEIFKPNEKYPYVLDKNSPALKIIQYARDEAHRFGIIFHRKKREKNFLQTQLTQIKGIGQKTAKKLLSHFQGIENIKNASIDDIEAVIGKSKAKLVFEYFHRNNGES